MKKIKIGFDISQLAHSGGVATYTRNLAERLSNISGLEMTYFYSSLRKPYIGKLPNVKSYKIPPTLLEILFNQLRFVTIDQLIGRVDIYHSSDWTQPKTSAKKVTTYHDVVPLKYPQWSDPKIISVHKKRLEIVEKEIDLVIAVSESTKKDLLEISKIPEEKIKVIYEGVDSKFHLRDQDEVEEFRRKHNLPEQFILAIGGIGERRNMDRVRESAKGYNLVVTGETLPRLQDEEMPLLYSSAKLLLYPSLYEGFGLPILEAMGCGCPVITSNISSMPEVGGEAAVYVNPENMEDIKIAIREVIENNRKRDEMIKMGLEQVKKFSWEKCAKETSAVYQSLIG